MIRRTIGEIFTAMDDVPTRKEKAQVIRDAQFPAFVGFLNILREKITWEYETRELPEMKIEAPPAGYSEDNLANQMRRLYLFRADETKIDGKRKDEILVQMVEALSEKEAQILIALVTGSKMPAKMFTDKFVDDLFAGKI